MKAIRKVESRKFRLLVIDPETGKNIVILNLMYPKDVQEATRRCASAMRRGLVYEVFPIVKEAR